MVKKIKLFDQLEALYIEQEVLMKQSSALEQKKNIKWVSVTEKREKVWKKIHKLERFTWSKEARDSFKKFKIEGIEESGGSRGFTFKNKQIKFRSSCERCDAKLHGSTDYVDKVLTNGDEIWRCGNCKYLHTDPGNIFEYDNPPDSSLHTYYIIRRSDIEQAKKKVRTQKKTHEWYDIDQELYKGNLLKKWFTN